MSERDDDLEEFGLGGDEDRAKPAPTKPERAWERLTPAGGLTLPADIKPPPNALPTARPGAYLSADEIAKLAADRGPIGQRLEKKNEANFSLGPISGVPGEEKVVEVSPQLYFRCEKMIATDTGSPAGQGTMVVAIDVDGKAQRPASNGTLTMFFASNSLGRGVRWDTCRPKGTISIRIRFIQACTWHGALFGRVMAT